MALAKDLDVRSYLSLADRVQLEGVPWYGVAGSAYAATLTNGMTVGTVKFPGFSKALWIDTLTLSATRQADLQFITTGSYNSVQTLWRGVVTPNAPVIIPVRQLFRLYNTGSGGSDLGQLRVPQVLDANTTGYVEVALSGVAVYDDFDYAADKVMLIVGDSILNGTSGLTDKTKSMEWMIRSWFRQRGKRVRVINRSVSGSTSTDHERFRAHGGYDFPQVDYLHYQLGTNDAGLGVSAATYKANVAAMIAHKQALYPRAQMVVWGSTPRQNNTHETALIALRTAAQEAVTAAADSRVRYASLAASFDRTNEANYAASDTTGDKVHPNDTGHAGAFAVAQTALNGWNLASLI